METMQQIKLKMKVLRKFTLKTRRQQYTQTYRQSHTNADLHCECKYIHTPV